MARKRKVIDVEPTEQKGVMETTLTPSQYFDILKDRAKTADGEKLKQLYDNCCTLMRKYQITGQVKGAEKLYKYAELCERELKILEAGFPIYIERMDLDEYIEKIANKAVVIIELSNYERDLPDDVVEKIAIAKEKDLFDDYIIVYTDYTGKERKKIEKEKREKDPILLGVLNIGRSVSNRMYHIASWVDEYCDLTLDKMVEEFAKAKGNDAPSMTKSLEEEFGSLEDFKTSFTRFKVNHE